MSKNKILCLLLGVLICLNVSLCSYKETYALVGVDDALVQSFVQAFFQTAFFNLPNNQEGRDAANTDILNTTTDFIEYLQEDYPLLWDALTFALSTRVSLKSSGDNDYKIGSFYLSPSLASQLFNVMNAFLLNKGTINSETGDFSFESSQSSGSSGDAFGGPVTASYSDINDVIAACNEYSMSTLGYACFNRGFTMFQNDLPEGVCYFQCVFHAGLRVLTARRVSSDGAVQWCCWYHSGTNGPADWYDHTTVPTVNIAFPSSGDDTVYGPAIPTNFDLASAAAAAQACDNFVTENSDDVYTHNADSTTTVSRHIAYNQVYVEQTNEETGEKELVPLTPKLASDLGIDLDNSFSKPQDTTRTDPLVDSQTGENVKSGSITGSVSITNFRSIASAIFSSFSGILNSILNAILSIPIAISGNPSAVFDVFSAILNSILNGILSIPTAISGIASAVFDVFSSILNSILNGILSIPTAILGNPSAVFDAFSSILNSILNGILSIPTAILGNPSAVFDVFSNILNSILNAILSIPTALASIPSAIANVAQSVWDLFKTAIENISTAIGGIASAIEYIFVPDYSGLFSLAGEVREKFSFIDQLDLLWRQLLNHSFDPQQAPKFSFNLPSLFFKEGSYQTKECLVVDFTTFMEWRTFLDNIIVLLAYLAYFKRLYAILPTVFGFGTAVSSVQHSEVVNTKVG